MTKNIGIKVASGESSLSADIKNNFKIQNNEELERNKSEVGGISKELNYIQFRRSKDSIYRRYN
ncbi:MAG: hypothetical protein WC812_03545 [Candidatus Pacearchaeota archaeon]|jgi:hypothetical protein